MIIVRKHKGGQLDIPNDNRLKKSLNGPVKFGKGSIVLYVYARKNS